MTTTENSPQASLAPYIAVTDAAAAIKFYAEAFGARECYRLTDPSGKIGHAELDIGGQLLMLADEYPDFGSVSPVSLGGSPVKFLITVDDVDAALVKATDAGATAVRPASDEFHGHRQALVACPFGYQWFLSCQVEVVEPAEMQRRFNAAFG